MNLPVFKEQMVSSNCVVLNLELPVDAEAFRGHFPDQPILPGVVQLDWVMGFAKKYFNIACPSAQAFQVKFTHVVQPGQIEMHLKYSGNRLSFEYKSNTQKYSSGSIILSESLT